MFSFFVISKIIGLIVIDSYSLIDKTKNLITFTFLIDLFNGEYNCRIITLNT